MAFDNFRGRALAPKTISAESDFSLPQIHRWIRDGKIKAARLGARMTRIDGDSLADFLTSHLDVPRPPRGKHAKPKSTELAGQA